MKNHKLNGDSFIPQKDLTEALKANFPSVFSDGKVDLEKLKLAIGENFSSDNERYGLSWTGMSDCFREIQTATTATLKTKKEESVDFDQTGNVFIEGDNLETLKVLQRSYYGKIKCIYIDPPYNTGNDFIYNDNFRKTRKEEMTESGDLDENGDLTRVDGLSVNRKDSNGHFHSDWLNMMYPRLSLARNLLKQDGVIFVSIDDNEVHNLRMIMDEIFGEENFVVEFVWRRTDNQPNIGNIARVKEYILGYSRNIEELKMYKMQLTEKAKKEYRYSDEKGKFRRAILLDKTRGRHFYDIKTPKGKILNGPWMIKEERFRELEKTNGIYWTNGGDEQPYGKLYLKDSEGQISNDFLGIEFGTNQQAGLKLEKLFNGKRFFDFPKPTSLIGHFIKIGSDKDDIILDFFAGSGTTAQAVMEQNAEDGGNRKWICVQLPELCDEKSEAFKAGYKNIAEISKERIRRAGKNIKEDSRIISSPITSFDSKPPKPKKETSKDILEKLDIGFKSLSLDESNFKIWQRKARDEKSLLSDLEEFTENVKSESNDENILYELILKNGLDLNVSIEEKNFEGEKYFDLENGKLFVYLGENISEKMAEELIGKRPEKIICLERAFKNNDELKANILIQAEQENVDFRVV